LVRRAGVIRDQVPVLMNDAIRFKAPGLVECFQEDRKNRSEPGCRTEICIEMRFRRNFPRPNEIALLKRHRLLLTFVGSCCAVALDSFASSGEISVVAISRTSLA
jgi:hypothetical protein